MNDSSSPTSDESLYEAFRRDTHCRDHLYAQGIPLTPEDEAERFHGELLDSIADGVYGLDLQGYVTYVNPAARRMTGWSIDDLRGRTQHSMVHHSHADGSRYPREECPMVASLRDGQTSRRSDEVFWRKDGSSFPVAYTTSPIFRRGKPDGAVIIFQDLSQQQGEY